MTRRLLDIDKIQRHQRAFARKRDWDQFHTPKNLAMALAGEAAELLELFQWLTPKESQQIMADRHAAESVRHELADILYYVVRLADRLNVDLETAFWEKFRLNEKKYPVKKSKGKARKYTELT